MKRIYAQYENSTKAIDLEENIDTITKLRKKMKGLFSLQANLQDITFPDLSMERLRPNVLDCYISNDKPLLIRMVKSVKNPIYKAAQEIESLAINLKVSPKIFVRDCYTELWNEFRSYETKQKAIMKNHPERIPHIYLTGTPGIGKTAFLVYMIQLLLTQNRQVLFGSGVLDNFLFWGPKKKFKMVYEKDLGQYTSRSDITFLMDSRDFPATTGTIIVCSSPRAGIAGQYRKTAKKLFMPVWRWEEIQDLYSGVYTDLISENHLAARFFLLGGIPRYLFDHLDSSVSDILRDAISATQEANLKKLVESKAEISKSKNTTGEVSHRLLHLNGSNEDDPPFGKPREQYASSYVATMILERYKIYRRQLVIQWIEETTDVGIAGGLRGNLFENIAHSGLKKGGSFSYRVLTDQGTPESLRIPSAELVPVTDISSLENLREEGKYYKPRAKTFECIDSWIVMDGEAWGFQFTVSAKHRITSALYWFFKKLNLRHYVTVVFDQDKFEKFKNQNVTPSKKPPFCNEDMPNEFSDLKQYVLLYAPDTVDVNDLWDIQKKEFESFIPKPWSSDVTKEYESAFQ